MYSSERNRIKQLWYRLNHLGHRLIHWGHRLTHWGHRLTHWRRRMALSRFNVDIALRRGAQVGVVTFRAVAGF